MAFFQPRPAMKYLPPNKPDRKTPHPVQSIAACVAAFETETPKKVTQLTSEEKRALKLKTRRRRKKKRQAATVAKFDPKTNEEATKNAYKTLFVGRLSYEITAEMLKKEFEYYGKVNDAILVCDAAGKSRGYGFAEFDSSSDMKTAYSDADGRRVHGRRIVVDVERGRTVKDWLPRRHSGGLGGTRIGGPRENARYSGRAPPPGTVAANGDRGERGSERRSDRRGGDERGGRGGDDRKRGRDDNGYDDRERSRQRR
jgi:U1 small nuclear ribonucleoprotein